MLDANLFLSINKNEGFTPPMVWQIETRRAGLHICTHANKQKILVEKKQRFFMMKKL